MKFLLGVVALASAAVKEELTGDEFLDLKDKSPLFVKFYAPWCGHCKNLAPTWTEMAEEINPDAEWEAQIVSVDCTQHKEVCSDNGVKGYPTLKLFIPGVAEGTKYQGARSKQALTDWLDGELAKQFDEPAAEEEAAPAAAAPKKGEVAVLTAASFKNTVAPAEQVTFVKFFAPWCGHCKKMAQTWVDLAKDQAANENVVIAEVDCTVEQSVCQENGVKGYPTLKAFKGGKEIEKYAGGRDMASFKAALTKYTGAAPKAQEDKPAASAGTGSTDLTAENFASSVGAGNWFVKFYAPWCGHCKSMAQTWEDLANAQKDSNPKVNIASVDCTQHNDACKEHGVKGFPTLLFFQNGKNLGKHQGGRDQKSLESSIKSFVNPSAAKDEEKKPAGADTGKFDADMAGKHTFVKFFAPWCGHCKSMAPAWKELQTAFEGSASTQILDVDCTSDEGKPLCQAAGVRGYPTLQYFGPKIVLGSGEKYAGGRDLASLKKFIEGKATEHDEL